MAYPIRLNQRAWFVGPHPKKSLNHKGWKKTKLRKRKRKKQPWFIWRNDKLSSASYAEKVRYLQLDKRRKLIPQGKRTDKLSLIRIDKPILEIRLLLNERLTLWGLIAYTAGRIVCKRALMKLIFHSYSSTSVDPTWNLGSLYRDRRFFFTSPTADVG